MKTVVVCGATGKQGGAVVECLSKTKNFKIVALSRSPNGKAGMAMKEKGIEVMKADLQDKRSLVNAFRGADYV